MNLTISPSRHYALAAVSGDITHAVSPQFQESLLGALASHPALVLECSGIGILTSAGLRALLLLHRAAQTDGKRLALAGVPQSVRDVMEITGFWTHFAVFESEDAAAETLRQPA